ncbi:MAG: hypothetical protein JSV96_17340 [Candidatus Aminicenantes bacterium]|nr:MAG: hypothetical protein JSV96_17340 [Candidatus Aminicenantes bacterium]
MPDASIKVEGKKFMWDGVVYETEKEAQDTMQKYKDDNFEVEMKEEEGKHLLYTRRLVTEIVVEGEAPP